MPAAGRRRTSPCCRGCSATAPWSNATGCSSIYGGNLPTTPWTKDKEGRGPAWANSLFEDNAEFGLGYRLSLDKHHEQAVELLKALAPQLGAVRVDEILEASQNTHDEVDAQRRRVPPNAGGSGATPSSSLSGCAAPSGVFKRGG